MNRGVVSIVIFLLSCFVSLAQDVVDQVIAVVGNEIILKSDVENQYLQMMSQGHYEASSDLKCDILEDLMFQKLLYLQALDDSIEIGDKEIEQELDRRLSVFINQLGSESKLEEYYGKSIKEIKSDFRGVIKEQMLTQRAQAALTADIKVTPSEVKAFYDAIPPDSIPLVEPYYELSEIVFKPKTGRAEREATIAKLNAIRERILKGESFSTLAILYSEDHGTAAKGGELGFVGRNDLVPEFASVAFNLTNTKEVSPVVETEYGFHIIQLIEKKGNVMNFRHILLTPVVSVEQIQEAENKANEVWSLIQNDSLTFAEAVEKFSDGDTKFNGGKMINQYYRNTKLSDDFVDMPTRRALTNMQVGDVSKPYLSTTTKGAKIIRIVKLVTKVEKHFANLKDDYQEIQEFATQKESQRVIEKWIKRKLTGTYVHLNDVYGNCDFKYVDWSHQSQGITH